MESRTNTWVRRSFATRVGFRFVVLGITVLFFSVTLTTAFAQESDTNSETLEEVVVEAERVNRPTLMDDSPKAHPGGQTSRGMNFGPLGNLDQRDIPFSFTAFTDTAYEERQALSINELIDDDPSVQRETARNTYFTGIQIRGLDGAYVFNGQPGVYHRDLVPSPEQFSRMELVKGPNSFVGSNAPADAGGMVNLVPKRATDREVSNMTFAKLPGSATKYHLDVGKRFGANDAFGIRVNAAMEDGELNVDNVERERNSFVIALDHQGENHRITLDLEQTDRNSIGSQPWFSVSAGLDVPEAPNLNRTYGQPWADFEQEFQSMVLQGEYDLNPNWTIGAAWSEARVDEFGQWQGFATITDSAGNYSWFTNTNWTGDAEYTTLRGYAKGRFRTGEIEHNVSLTSVYLQDIFQGQRGNRTFVSSNLSNPNYVAEPSIGGRRVFPWTEDENALVSIGDKMEVTDRLDVIAGLQWAEMTANSFNDTGATTDNANADDISPIAGFNYDYNPNLTLYGSYAESLEPGEEAPPGADNAGQTTDPTITEQLQFGGKFEYGLLSGDLAYFETEKQNAFLDPVTNVFAQNGLRVNEGLELTLNGKAYRNLTVTGGITWMDAEQVETQGGTNDGNRPIATPEVKANFNLRYDYPAIEGLTYSAALEHVGEQFHDAANNQSVPIYTTADLGASYSFDFDGTPMKAQFDVTNITDERYWNTSTIGLMPGNPRSYHLSLKTSF